MVCNAPVLGAYPGTTPLGRYHGMRGRVQRVPGNIVCHRTKSYYIYVHVDLQKVFALNRGQRERSFRHIVPNKRKETEKPVNSPNMS